MQLPSPVTDTKVVWWERRPRHFDATPTPFVTVDGDERASHGDTATLPFKHARVVEQSNWASFHLTLSCEIAICHLGVMVTRLLPVREEMAGYDLDRWTSFFPRDGLINRLLSQYLWTLWQSIWRLPPRMLLSGVNPTAVETLGRPDRIDLVHRSV